MQEINLLKPLKSLFNYVLIFIVTIALLELVAFLSFSAFTSQPFKRKILAQTRTIRIQTIEEKLNLQEHDSQTLYQFHPYVGYTGHPGVRPWGNNQPPFNAYGMLSIFNHPYPYKKQKNEFVVAVLGGSVAENFANLGEKHVNRILEEEYDIERKVVLLNLATGGYKQPQQLFHLQFALLSRFELDVVLNIDGFNDLVLAVQNLENGINPLFPSGQHLGLMSKLGAGLDRQMVQSLANYYALYEQELGLLRILNRTPFKYSISSALLGEIWMKRSQAVINQAEYRLVNEAQKRMTQAFLGPPLPTAAPAYETVVNIWQHASRLLYTIAREHDLIYIHALQPNQYVEGSKPLSAHERKIAYNPQNPWGRLVREGYIVLRKAGEQLKIEGLPFYDLTMLFQDNKEDIYTDSCCHFGKEGNSILAQQIVNIMLKELKRQGKTLESL